MVNFNLFSFRFAWRSAGHLRASEKVYEKDIKIALISRGVKANLLLALAGEFFWFSFARLDFEALNNFFFVLRSVELSVCPQFRVWELFFIYASSSDLKQYKIVQKRNDGS